MIYTSSRLDFQGDSEFQLKNLKCHQWHPPCLCWCFRHISGKCDLHQSGWFIHHQDLIFKGALNIRSEFWNSISGICYGHISVWADCGKILSPPIRIICTSSWPHFQGGPDHLIRILKFHQWHLLWPYQCLGRLENITPLQLEWFIHHLDRIFKGVLTIWSEFWNSISGICYGYISVWGRLRENIIPSNQDDLYIILTTFSRGFWPSNQNF